VHERYRQTTDRQTTDDRQTDGRAIAYSEREREFTFANILLLLLRSISAQITDYGLPSFLAAQNFDDSEHDTYRRE